MHTFVFCFTAERRAIREHSREPNTLILLLLALLASWRFIIVKFSVLSVSAWLILCLSAVTLPAR